MKRSILRIVLLSIAVAAACPARAADGPGRWTEKQANDWYAHQPWLVGCNFIPSTAINELEMWQADTFDPDTIDRELGWAESLGFTSVRVFLHNLVWDQDSEGFLKRMDRFLEIADRHKIGAMFVIFDSCWDAHPKLGRQRDPRPHVHNSGWVQCPGVDILGDPSRHDSLKPYVQGVIRRFANDPRVQVWDLMNEADNGDQPKNKAELAQQLLEKTFAWAREVAPSQPLTAGIWRDYKGYDSAPPIFKFMLDNSDVITFHNYSPLADLEREVALLKKESGRPLLCTEFMARTAGSRFDPNLGYLKSQRVGAYCWGLVDGKTNTIYPWDSCSKPYTEPPPVWFHDVFHKDGTPYSADEAAYIRGLTGREE